MAGVNYLDVRHLHVGAAMLSIGLFVVRGALMVPSPGRMLARPMRVLPHVVDTVLLASALWLAWQLGIQGTHGWLWAKVLGVVGYIVLGTLALKRGRSVRTRAIAFVLAVLTFGYVASV